MARLSDDRIDMVYLDPSVDGPGRHTDNKTIAEVCHDLRQPLATISALAEAATTIPGVPDEVRHRLEQVLAEARRMSDLTRRLLGDTLALVPLDASQVAAEVVESARVTFAGRIEAVASPGTTVIADEPALRRAVANLVENAVRAAGPCGSVLVSVRRSGDWVSLQVDDSGPGFGGAPNGTARLGLTIVDRVVRSHGGRVSVDRGSLGGALVRLDLPAPRAGRPGTRRPGAGRMASGS